MKKINFFAVIAIICAVTMGFSSCDDGYDEWYDEAMQNQPSDDNNNGDDEGNVEEGDWGTVMGKTYGYLGDNEWPSVIILHKNGTEVKFEVNLPFSYTKWQDEFLTTEDSIRSEFVEVEEADTVCSAWEKDGKGNYLRKVTRTQVINFSKFTRTVTSESWEAYRMINGKQEYYDTGSTSLSFNPYSNHTQSLSEVEVDSVIYEREINFVETAITYHTETFYVSANTTIDRKIGTIEDDSDDNNNSEESEEMPSADLIVDKIVRVSNITSSPIYVSIDKVEWHNVSFIETTDKYYVYVDGIQNCSWNKSDLAKSDIYNSYINNSVVYEPTRKQWIPAVLTVGSDGWDYVCEFADHSYKQVSVSMNLACASGIKNFTENNTAEVSPWVKTIIDSRTYNGKQWTKVSGFNVDGKITITYTVAEK